jgi:hypothetical protein
MKNLYCRVPYVSGSTGIPRVGHGIAISEIRKFPLLVSNGGGVDPQPHLGPDLGKDLDGDDQKSRS